MLKANEIVKGAAKENTETLIPKSPDTIRKMSEKEHEEFVKAGREKMAKDIKEGNEKVWKSFDAVPDRKGVQALRIRMNKEKYLPLLYEFSEPPYREQERFNKITGKMEKFRKFSDTYNSDFNLDRKILYMFCEMMNWEEAICEQVTRSSNFRRDLLEMGIVKMHIQFLKVKGYPYVN